MGARTQKAIKNIVYGIAGQIVTLILSFIARSVFIKSFGIEYLGINGVFSDVLNLLSMADLGFGTAMVYSLYKPLAEMDYDRVSSLISFYKKVYWLIAILVMAFGLLAIPFLPLIVNLEHDLPYLNIYYILSLFNIAVSYLCVYQTTILSADQRGFVITKISIIFNIIKTVLQIASALIWNEYILYLVIGACSSVFNNIFTSWIAKKEYPFMNSGGVLKREEKKHIFLNLGSVFLYKVSGVLINATDNILISMIVGTVAVGLYSNYLMLQNKIITFYTLIFTSTIAGIGNLIVTENEHKRYEVFQAEQSLSFIISSIVIPCFVLSVNEFIVIWLGEAFLLPQNVVCMIGLNMYLNCVLQPLWSYREATGLYKDTKWIMILCAICNLVLSVVLGRMMGVAGILFASAISRLITYFWYEPKILYRKYFGRDAASYFRQLFGNGIWIIILILLIKQCTREIRIESITFWIVKTLIIAGTCLLLTCIIYHKSAGINVLMKRITNSITLQRKQIRK